VRRHWRGVPGTEQKLMVVGIALVDEYLLHADAGEYKYVSVFLFFCSRQNGLFLTRH